MAQVNTDELSIGDVAELLVNKLVERESELEVEMANVRRFRDGLLALARPTSVQSPLPSGMNDDHLSTHDDNAARPKITRDTSSEALRDNAPTRRKNTNWGKVHEALVSGEIDQYVTTIKTSSVDATKSTLLKRFDGLEIDAYSREDGTSMLEVRLRTDAARAA